MKRIEGGNFYVFLLRRRQFSVRAIGKENTVTQVHYSLFWTENIICLYLTKVNDPGFNGAEFFAFMVIKIENKKILNTI